jgi:hypothetical protein
MKRLIMAAVMRVKPARGGSNAGDRVVVWVSGRAQRQGCSGQLGG